MSTTMSIRPILVLALCLFLIGFGPAPDARAAGPTYAFSPDTLCSSGLNGLVSFDAATGELVIDFNSPTLDGYNAVEISSYTVGSCRSALHSLSFVNRATDPITDLTIRYAAFGSSGGTGTALAEVTFPEGLTNLTIEGEAFAHLEDTLPGLTTVNFPRSVTNLTIGDSAFEQVGTVTLATVNLPQTVSTLTIKSVAFHQFALTGSTALTSVVFPSGLSNLTISYNAFLQSAAHGSATLASVSFPSGLTALSIGADAFSQVGAVSSALEQVIFRATAPMGGGSGDLSIDATAFNGTGPGWFWFGADHTELSAAWDGTASGLNPTLAGYRELTFDATGGTTTGTIPGHYVYSNGSSYATPTVFDTSTWGTGFTVTLPDATRADYTFVGWCETSSCDGYLPRSVTTQGTSASPRPAGTSYDLAANRTLYAIWSLNPPTITSAAALGSVTAGKTLTLPIATTGAEIVCTLASGSTLPAGLSLNGCTITGTPTTAGQYSFTIDATNAAGTDSQAFTLTITAAATPTPVPTDNADLPRTGADSTLPLLGMGIIAIGLGGSLVLLGRRRLN
ncbi:MAG TPA: leucine-rich repeat protein [Propionicimonas sp.]|nr:leucine-rich repeat protein [Propionicimonas sp.]